MESSSHAVPRTTAAPVTMDSLSPAHLLTFTLGTALGKLALAPFNRLPAHTLRESCAQSSPVAFLFSVVRQLPGWPLGWGWSGREGRELQLWSCQPGQG